MNTPEKNSPAGKYEEGYLLEPRFEDANGHAAGIKARVVRSGGFRLTDNSGGWRRTVSGTSTISP